MHLLRADASPCRCVLWCGWRLHVACVARWWSMWSCACRVLMVTMPIWWHEYNESTYRRWVMVTSPWHFPFLILKLVVWGGNDVEEDVGQQAGTMMGEIQEGQSLRLGNVCLIRCHSNVGMMLMLELENTTFLLPKEKRKETSMRFLDKLGDVWLCVSN